MIRGYVSAAMDILDGEGDRARAGAMSSSWRPSARNGPVMAARVTRDPADPVKDRKERFDRLNRFVSDRGGWIVSIPGARNVIIEAISVTIASDLKGLDYLPVGIEGGRRIISGAIEERFVRTASGALVPWIEASGKVVAEVRHHAGIVPTRRYSFSIS
jgi:hypothetical protein